MHLACSRACGSWPGAPTPGPQTDSGSAPLEAPEEVPLKAFKGVNRPGIFKRFLVNSEVRLELLCSILDLLVVTAGFARLERGPDVSREVRSSSGSRFWRFHQKDDFIHAEDEFIHA